MHFDPFSGASDLFESLFDNPKGIPDIPWNKYSGEKYHKAWQVLRSWPVSERVMPSKEEDEAAALLADLF